MEESRLAQYDKTFDNFYLNCETVLPFKSVRGERLPEEESEYLEKVDEGTKKVEEKKEEEKTGLMDVLKKRKIITEKLSDEKESEHKEEVKTEEKPEGEKTEEIPSAGSK